jgi:hypothetical protein
MDGGCYCGQVRYRLTAAPFYVNACHCRDCQKLTGAAFALNAMIEDERIERVQGVPERDAEGCFRCPRCHVLLWASHPMFGEAIRFLRAGTLDESERIVPDAHFFTRSKHPWVTIPDGARAFDTLPGEGETLFSPQQQARVEKAMAQQQGAAQA